MAEPKDGGGGFLRKVARFVTNPATDWNELAGRQEDHLDLERAELKAMIERKRRNDFVRKREFDTLRKLRRDGLSPEQLAALGGSSKVEDSEVRASEAAPGARAESGVKAKIDAIEQQMVGDGQTRPAEPPPQRRRAPEPPRGPRPTPPSDFYTQPTEPVSLQSEPPPSHPALDHLPPLKPLPDLDFAAPASAYALPARDAGHSARRPAAPSGPAARTPAGPPPGQAAAKPAAAPLPPRAAPAQPPAPVAPTARNLPRSLRGEPEFGVSSRFAVEVSEVVHDPELDEAVIAFANADFQVCEQSLTALCRPQAPRHQHAETWLVLFDLYRAIGQQARFDALSLTYTHQFGRSSPQWYSLPKQVSDAAAGQRPDTRGVQGDVGWISPPVLDPDAVAQLRSATLQLPLPWVLDWSALEQVQPQAASQLQALFRQWAPQPLDMRWLAADRLLTALQEAAPTGVRDADTAFWMARLEALRLANRPDQFDETAIDYCVTYEVSPPSWERASCLVRFSGGGHATTVPPMSIVGEVTSSFLESHLHDDSRPAQQVATVELSGQLAGDIAPTLQQLDRKLGAATLVSVSCARLIRVDFIAAGDLLNWVLAKQSENRSVTFTEAHRLVALFFGAMGINEHARVQVIRQ